LRRHLSDDWRSRTFEHDAFPRDHADARHMLASGGAQDGERLAFAKEACTATLEPMNRSFEDRDVVPVLSKQRRGE
jgi:hypothetical protein